MDKAILFKYFETEIQLTPIFCDILELKQFRGMCVRWETRTVLFPVL